MFLDDKPNYQALPASFGRPTSGAENFAQAMEQESFIDSSRGFEARLGEYEQKNARLASQLSGEQISLPKKVVRSIRDGNATNESIEAQQKRYKERLIELKKIHPQIQTYDEIVAQIQKEAQEFELETQSMQERATFGGQIGAFAGAVVGSLDPETNPINVATLGIGGAGKSIALRVLSEAGTNAAIETINQFTGVAQNRRSLGLDNSTERMLTNILAAGVGAGALRGTFEGASIGFNKLKSSDIINMKASELMEKFIPRAGRTEDIAIMNGFEREALEETIQETTPRTSNLSYERIGAAAYELETGIKNNDPFVFSRSDAEVEVADIADTFDFDIKEKLRIENEVRKYGNFAIDEVEQIAGQPVTTLKQLTNEVIERIHPQVKGDAKKIARLITDNAVARSVAKQAYERGYFPEYKSAKGVELDKLRQAIDDEQNGVYRYDANVRDAMEAEIEASQNHYDEYLEAKTVEALDTEERLAKEYEKTEIADLDRAVNEIRQSDRAISVERTDGTIETVKLSKLLDELDEERQILDAMKVCSI